MLAVLVAPTAYQMLLIRICLMSIASMVRSIQKEYDTSNSPRLQAVHGAAANSEDYCWMPRSFARAGKSSPEPPIHAPVHALAQALDTMPPALGDE
jgi:hypothetical protein